MAAQARDASQKVLPAGRGEINHMVQKRPAGNLAPIETIHGLGQVKMLLCSFKSYLTHYNSTTSKWPLLVESTTPNHQDVIRHLFLWAQHQKNLDKSKVVAHRAVVMKQLKYKQADIPEPSALTDSEDRDSEIAESGEEDEPDAG